MRVIAGLLLLALAAPVAAACPPAGHDHAALQVLKARGFVVDDAADRRALAVALLPCLAATDPALRDGIGYEALTTWMRAGAFDADTLRELRGLLDGQLKAPDPRGVLHPFAALVLSEVARTDRIAAWMSADEREQMLADALAYLAGVRDYRGFEDGIGWRHGVARGADWLLQLALNPALQPAQLQRVLDVVALQAVPEQGHAYVFGEPARLARPVAVVARRSVLDDAGWQAWLQGLRSRLGPMPAGGDARWLRRQHDLDAFLSALYLEADASQNPALQQLKPAIAKARADQ